MGYYTNYTLGTYNSHKDISNILENLSSDTFDGLDYALDENGECYDSVTWYDHEEDMKKLSLQFPDIVFELHGEGETPGDIWNKYFKNGKMQVCYAKITYDDFDEDELM